MGVSRRAEEHLSPRPLADPGWPARTWGTVPPARARCRPIPAILPAPRRRNRGWTGRFASNVAGTGAARTTGNGASWEERSVDSDIRGYGKSGKLKKGRGGPGESAFFPRSRSRQCGDSSRASAWWPSWPPSWRRLSTAQPDKEKEKDKEKAKEEKKPAVDPRVEKLEAALKALELCLERIEKVLKALADKVGKIDKLEEAPKKLEKFDEALKKLEAWRSSKSSKGCSRASASPGGPGKGRRQARACAWRRWRNCPHAWTSWNWG